MTQPLYITNNYLSSRYISFAIHKLYIHTKTFSLQIYRREILVCGGEEENV